MVKFLGAPLDIPQAATNTQAVRKQYVDAADTALSNRVTTLESSAGDSGSGLVTTSKTAAYTATASQLVLADATSGPFTITLPASPAANTVVAVKKTDTSGNIVTIVGSGAAKIDGDNTATIGTKGIAATFIYDGTNWRISSTVAFDSAASYTYRGTWSNITPYYVNDTVSFNGSSYVAISANTGSTPPAGTSNSTWGLMAARGTDGTNGSSPTFTSNTATRLSANATPTVSVTGTPPNLSLALGVPVGQPVFSDATGRDAFFGSTNYTTGITTAVAGSACYMTDTNAEWVVVPFAGSNYWVPRAGTPIITCTAQNNTTTCPNNGYAAIQFDTAVITNNAYNVNGVTIWQNVATPTNLRTRFYMPWPGMYELSGALSWVSGAAGLRNTAWSVTNLSGTSSYYNYGTNRNQLGVTAAVSYSARTMVVPISTIGFYVELHGGVSGGANVNIDTGSQVYSYVGIKYMGMSGYSAA